MERERSRGGGSGGWEKLGEGVGDGGGRGGKEGQRRRGCRNSLYLHVYYRWIGEKYDGVRYCWNPKQQKMYLLWWVV